MKITMFLLMITVLFVACDVANIDSPDQNITSTAVKIETTTIDVEQFTKLLDSQIPNWDNNILSIPPNVSQESFFKSKDPTSLAAGMSKNSMKFSRETLSGKTVLTTDDKQEAIMVREETGFWKYITPPPTIKKTSVHFSDEEALKKTRALFSSFKMPDRETVGYVATGVGEAALGPDRVLSKPKVSARHVRLFREVNGIRVFGSRLMVTYALDGTPFRVEASWPPFKLTQKASKPIARGNAINDLSQTLAEMYSTIDDVKEIKTQMVYLYDEDDLTFDPTILVQIRPTNPENGVATIEYSLTSGLNKFEDLGIPKDNDIDDQ